MKNNIFGEMERLEDKAGFLDFVKDIKDHRMDRKKLHSVAEIVFLAFCGYIANCNSRKDLESFGHTKLEFLRRFLSYKNGIPSDDTLRRFFRILDPKVFEDMFERWVSYIFAAVDTAGKVTAIDGKASRGSHDGQAKAIHVVSAFVGEDKITLAQRKVDCKTNEIKVIPELLDAIDLKAAIVTIDAMGTQHKIANQIIEKEANYILALKGNQGTLEKNVKEIFTHAAQINANYISIHESSDAKNHGRMEQRICTVMTAPDWIAWLKDARKEWHNINCVIRISSTIANPIRLPIC